MTANAYPHSPIRPRRGLTRSLTTLASCLLLSVACNGDDPAPPGGGPGERPPPGVRVVTADGDALELDVAFTGELVARTAVALSPDVSGRLLELAVDEGDAVSAGSVIGRVDDETARDRRAEARARLESARARVALAEAEVTGRANEIARREPLAARDAFPAAELDALRDALRVDEQALTVARAQEAEAEAELAALRTELDRSTLVAPFDGLVVTRHVSAGAMVGPQTPVVTLVDPTSLRFVFRLAETRIGALSTDTHATLRFDAYPDRTFDARVSYIGSVVDRASRTVEVRLDVEPGDAALRDGMFGRGVIVTGRIDGGVVLPPDAVQATRDGSERVWVVRDGHAFSVQTEVLGRSEDAVAVSGVAPGASVIVAPPMGLTDDAPVYVVGATLPSAERPAADGSGAPK